MKCKWHKGKLETQEQEKTRAVAWSDEKIKIYKDVEYCPKCFELYTEGQPFRNDLIPNNLNQLKV